MNAALWIFLAGAFGLMLFVSIQDEIPKELEFLRAGPPPVYAEDAALKKTTVQLEGWTVSHVGQVYEATKRMSGEIVANGTSYDVPTVGLLCNAGVLDARVDTRMTTTGTKTTKVLMGDKPSNWPKGTGNNVFPVDAKAFLEHVKTGPTAKFSFSYVDLGLQPVTLNTEAMSKVLELFPATCR